MLYFSLDSYFNIAAGEFQNQKTLLGEVQESSDCSVAGFSSVLSVWLFVEMYPFGYDLERQDHVYFPLHLLYVVGECLP